MWRKAVLRMPGNMQALTCSMVPAHPWVYGVGRQETSGSYLSPANAVDYLAGRLAGQGEEISATVFMICANSHTEFMPLVTALAGVLPLPAMSQVQRMAQTAATQAVTRMQLPGKIGGGLPAAVPLSTSAQRLALNAQRIAEAKAGAAIGASVGGLQSALAGFAQARQSALDVVSQAMAALQGKSAPAWVFTAKGAAASVGAAMKKDIPHQDAVFTLAVLFVGKDLEQLEAMIHDDSHAGA
ncbi:hypothetical protein [Serratia fonticola]|uniref:hypothetical protein n=1 Tax=Serratia fonticola TaxID=47917 RepID=UPI000BFB7885|nr:hypothetical protein [Serratia fonticola]ATM78676.1 hypothetical protein CRN79_23845 [Serratia fonticola]